MFYYFFSSFSHPDKNVYKYYIYVNPTLSILFHFSIPIIFLYTDKKMTIFVLCSLFSILTNKYAQIHLDFSIFYHFSMLFFLYPINFLSCDDKKICTNTFGFLSIIYHFSMLIFLYHDKKCVQIH